MKYRLSPLIFLLMILLSSCNSPKEPSTSASKAIYFDGAEISQEQLELYKQRCRAQVLAEYAAEDEEVIQRELEKRAKAECYYEQMVLIVAEEKGLIDSASFADMKAQMEEENRKRGEALEEGQTVYGNKEYSLDTYVSYYISNLTRELEEILFEEGKEDKAELFEQYIQERVDRASKE